LVIVGHLTGTRLGLEFTVIEIAAVMLSVGAVTLLIHDGKTNWFEGLRLLAIYAILAVAFFYT
jgi:Ca2+:H+ antiporter